MAETLNNKLIQIIAYADYLVCISHIRKELYSDRFNKDETKTIDLNIIEGNIKCIRYTHSVRENKRVEDTSKFQEVCILKSNKKLKL